MRKRVLICATLIIVIIGFCLFEETAAQFISVILVLAVPAIVLAQNIEKAGTRALLFALEPVLMGLCKALAETKFAEYFSWFCNAAIELVCRKIGSQIPAPVGNETALLVVFWTIFIIAILLLGRINRTAMGVHSGGGDSEFQERNFLDKSSSFCQELRQRLETINRETDWNENLFTPIEAEVEVNIRGKHKKNYTDLLKCLKKTRRGSDVFLVLGDPGAGKSVALRKLCLELLKEAKKTKKIPVYINLKRWNKSWSLDQLPNKNDLIKFIRESLYENGDIFTDEFLNSYFDKMLKEGRWYFVFDSFDEMPCLMGKKNCQELIDHISELLFQFLTGSNQSGGVIASRLYKAPSEAMKPTVVLRIQEFNDIKIQQMLKKYLNHAEDVVKELFGKREDLVVLCRNPFYLTLLINFVREKGLTFPKNQMELYSNFVEGRLRKCAGKLESEHFSAENVHNAAKRLAVFFQESAEYGLECPAHELYQQVDGSDQEYWRKALKILEYAKICRFGGADETVSFVHRRFQEFFFVENIIERAQDIGDAEYGGIAHASGLRDALVLYCDVAEEEKAHEIAEYCWKMIQKNIAFRTSILTREGIALVNVLDFMAEAFRNRRSVLSDFIENFEQLVKDSLDERTDFIVLLSLVNSMVLFDQRHLQEAVLSVFRLKNRWLNDAVMQNFRLIQRLDRRLETKFSAYFFTMDMRTFLRRYRNMRFSLSISDSFRYIRIIHDGILLRYLSLMVATVFDLIIVPVKMISYNAQQFTGTNAKFANFAVQNISLSDLMKMAALLIVFGSYTFSIKTSAMLKRPYHHEGVLIWMISDFYRAALPPIIIFIFLWTVFSINAFWFLAFTIAFAGVHWLIIIHDIFPLSRVKITKLLKHLLFFFLSATITVIGARIIEKYFKNLFAKIIPIYLGAVGIALVILLVITLIRYWRDRRWVKRRPGIQRITREELAKNLETLHFSKWRCFYVELLLQNKTKLEGEWPNDQRPGKEDDNLVRILAKLDCTSLDYYSCVFKT